MHRILKGVVNKLRYAGNMQNDNKMYGATIVGSAWCTTIKGVVMDHKFWQVDSCCRPNQAVDKVAFIPIGWFLHWPKIVTGDR